MKKSSKFLIIFMFFALTLTFSVVSAQDVDNMSNEELTTLLLQIMQKLQQEEDPASETDPEVQETPAPTTAPVPAADPEAIEEVIQITIYENKKLIIEALPGYMFIQPTQEPIPEISGSEPTIYTEPTFGKPCAPAIGGYLYWGYCGNSTVLSCGCG